MMGVKGVMGVMRVEGVSIGPKNSLFQFFSSSFTGRAKLFQCNRL